jgi:hypothetical protein
VPFARLRMSNPSPPDNLSRTNPRAKAPALTSRHFFAMRLVIDEEQVTARRAADALGVSRATAGGALRALERAGMLHGELVGGGELGYTATSEGRAWLEQRTPAGRGPA